MYNGKLENNFAAGQDKNLVKQSRTQRQNLEAVAKEYGDKISLELSNKELTSLNKKSSASLVSIQGLIKVQGVYLKSISNSLNKLVKLNSDFIQLFTKNLSKGINANIAVNSMMANKMGSKKSGIMAAYYDDGKRKEIIKGTKGINQIDSKGSYLISVIKQIAESQEKKINELISIFQDIPTDFVSRFKIGFTQTLMSDPKLKSIYKAFHSWVVPVLSYSKDLFKTLLGDFLPRRVPGIFSLLSLKKQGVWMNEIEFNKFLPIQTTVSILNAIHKNVWLLNHKTLPELIDKKRKGEDDLYEKGPLKRFLDDLGPVARLLGGAGLATAFLNPLTTVKFGYWGGSILTKYIALPLGQAIAGAVMANPITALTTLSVGALVRKMYVDRKAREAKLARQTDRNRLKAKGQLVTGGDVGIVTLDENGKTVTMREKDRSNTWSGYIKEEWNRKDRFKDGIIKGWYSMLRSVVGQDKLRAEREEEEKNDESKIISDFKNKFLLEINKDGRNIIDAIKGLKELEYDVRLMRSVVAGKSNFKEREAAREAKFFETSMANEKEKRTLYERYLDSGGTLGFLKGLLDYKFTSQDKSIREEFERYRRDGFFKTIANDLADARENPNQLPTNPNAYPSASEQIKNAWNDIISYINGDSRGASFVLDNDITEAGNAKTARNNEYQKSKGLSNLFTKRLTDSAIRRRLQGQLKSLDYNTQRHLDLEDEILQVFKGAFSFRTNAAIEDKFENDLMSSAKFASMFWDAKDKKAFMEKVEDLERIRGQKDKYNELTDKLNDASKIEDKDKVYKDYLYKGLYDQGTNHAYLKDILYSINRNLYNQTKKRPYAVLILKSLNEISRKMPFRDSRREMLKVLTARIAKTKQLLVDAKNERLDKLNRLAKNPSEKKLIEQQLSELTQKVQKYNIDIQDWQDQIDGKKPLKYTGDDAKHIQRNSYLDRIFINGKGGKPWLQEITSILRKGLLTDDSKIAYLSYLPHSISVEDLISNYEKRRTRLEDKGTSLHNQIQKYARGTKEYDDIKQKIDSNNDEIDKIENRIDWLKTSPDAKGTGNNDIFSDLARKMPWLEEINEAIFIKTKKQTKNNQKYPQYDYTSVFYDKNQGDKKSWLQLIYEDTHEIRKSIIIPNSSASANNQNNSKKRKGKLPYPNNTPTQPSSNTNVKAAYSQNTSNQKQKKYAINVDFDKDSNFERALKALYVNQSAAKIDQWATDADIKEFAEGGIVKRAVHAVIGEDGEEAVIPLRKADRLKPFTEAISKQISEYGGMTSDKIANVKKRLSNWTGVLLNNETVPKLFGSLMGESNVDSVKKTFKTLITKTLPKINKLVATPKSSILSSLISGGSAILSGIGSMWLPLLIGGGSFLLYKFIDGLLEKYGGHQLIQNVIEKGLEALKKYGVLDENYHFKGFKALASGAFSWMFDPTSNEDIKNAKNGNFNGIVTLVKEGFLSALSSANLSKILAPIITDPMSKVLEWSKNAVSTAWGKAWDVTKLIGSKIGNGVSKAYNGIMGSKPVQFIKGVGGKIWDGTKSVGSKIWSGASELYSNIMASKPVQLIKDTGGKIWEGAGKAYNGIANSKPVQAIKDFGGKIGAKASDAAKAVSESHMAKWLRVNIKLAKHNLSKWLSGVVSPSKLAKAEPVVDKVVSHTGWIKGTLKWLGKGLSLAGYIMIICDVAKDIYKTGVSGYNAMLGNGSADFNDDILRIGIGAVAAMAVGMATGGLGALNAYSMATFLYDLAMSTSNSDSELAVLGNDSPREFMKRLGINSIQEFRNLDEEDQHKITYTYSKIFRNANDIAVAKEQRKETQIQNLNELAKLTGMKSYQIANDDRFKNMFSDDVRKDMQELYDKKVAEHIPMSSGRTFKSSASDPIGNSMAYQIWSGSNNNNTINDSMVSQLWSGPGQIANLILSKLYKHKGKRGKPYMCARGVGNALLESGLISKYPGLDAYGYGDYLSKTPGFTNITGEFPNVKDLLNAPAGSICVFDRSDRTYTNSKGELSNRKSGHVTVLDGKGGEWSDRDADLTKLIKRAWQYDGYKVFYPTPGSRAGALSPHTTTKEFFDTFNKNPSTSSSGFSEWMKNAGSKISSGAKELYNDVANSEAAQWAKNKTNELYNDAANSKTGQWMKGMANTVQDNVKFNYDRLMGHYNNASTSTDISMASNGVVVPQSSADNEETDTAVREGNGILSSINSKLKTITSQDSLNSIGSKLDELNNNLKSFIKITSEKGQTVITNVTNAVQNTANSVMNGGANGGSAPINSTLDSALN